ncbi:hypothetical protein, variant [Aphanomyces invadans]|uniref:BRCT domain-containing protein n=1 Tax=Aphanomyces invadans TaxID=157072 RepID=A0A024TX86_9STRA|nr:hypothetical protein, variant [Aphanomyces invadans]ETV98638.1 hypothetical protein, variant [Aphanomyces invadans]|eukprot:XP_008872835.1 hypothetical protein, variant [Aphanomyces invadans]
MLACPHSFRVATFTLMGTLEMSPRTVPSMQQPCVHETVCAVVRYNLIKMVKAHGGNTSIVHRKTRVTHVIATNLSGSKTDAVLRSGGRVHCVHPQWIVDSIEKGKRQPEAKYVVCKDFTVSSSGMTFFTPSIVPQASKPPTRSLS